VGGEKIGWIHKSELHYHGEKPANVHISLLLLLMSEEYFSCLETAGLPDSKLREAKRLKERSESSSRMIRESGIDEPFISVCQGGERDNCSISRPRQVVLTGGPLVQSLFAALLCSAPSLIYCTRRSSRV